ncbi:putative protein T-ENOL isoform X3 [Callithrix jacchus]|nr:putative protein T-ENOL isoform X3 [Callithrix jacchus]XP_009007662.1 putative protein T-ENOL isoform X3 [Callithrix jacchus]XP_009007664.1 putative protein T-ENOL isoform X3 [Callithrix jacchus]XP_035123280.1 putative protein T-ENOL isoform X3 [Callithrix jacchus]
MASTPMGNEGEKKDSWPSQAAPSSRGGPASLCSSEEYLSRISAELTEEALFMACCHLNPVPIKKKQTQDQATQISTHGFFTKTRGTDTRSDRNCTHTKSHLLTARREKNMPQNSSFATR